MNKNLEIIRAACIEANPEIVEEHSVQCDMDTSHGYVTPHNELGCIVRPIHLADVLLAIASNRIRLTTFVGGDAWFESYEESNVFTHEQSWKARGVCWNLRLDDLTHQSPETLQFLADLLK